MYYVAEVARLHSLAKAEQLNAKSRTSAKRCASRYQMFQDTVLYLGETIDSSGYIVDPIAVKKDNKWIDLEC